MYYQRILLKISHHESLGFNPREAHVELAADKLAL
jgi:hypothetical protein